MTFLKELAKDRNGAEGPHPLNKWSERTIIALVMQNLDNSITTYTKKGVVGRPRSPASRGTGSRTRPGSRRATRPDDAVASRQRRRAGRAGGTWGDVFNIPLTAHFLGGCAIASDSPATGVIDPYHARVGYADAAASCDGCGRSANLGVNPSLTITAQAERAASLWPNKGEQDPRPAQGRGIPAPEPGRAGRTRSSRTRRPARCVLPIVGSADPASGSAGAGFLAAFTAKGLQPPPGEVVRPGDGSGGRRPLPRAGSLDLGAVLRWLRLASTRAPSPSLPDRALVRFREW